MAFSGYSRRSSAAAVVSLQVNRHHPAEFTGTVWPQLIHVAHGASLSPLPEAAYSPAGMPLQLVDSAMLLE